MKKKIISLLLIAVILILIYLFTQFLFKKEPENLIENFQQENKEDIIIKPAENFEEFQNRLNTLRNSDTQAVSSILIGNLKKNSSNSKCLACFDLTNLEGESINIKANTQEINQEILNSLQENDQILVEVVATQNENNEIVIIANNITEIEEDYQDEDSENSQIELEEVNPGSNPNYNQRYFMYLDIDNSWQEIQIDGNF